MSFKDCGTLPARVFAGSSCIDALCNSRLEPRSIRDRVGSTSGRRSSVKAALMLHAAVGQSRRSS